MTKSAKQTSQPHPALNEPAKAVRPATLDAGARLDYMATDSNINPKHVMLKIPDLMARYGCGKTTACAKVNEPDFPGEVAPRRWRLDHVMECEEARAWAGRSRPVSTTTPTEPGLGVADANLRSAARPTRSSNATV